MDDVEDLLTVEMDSEFLVEFSFGVGAVEVLGDLGDGDSRMSWQRKLPWPTRRSCWVILGALGLLRVMLCLAGAAWCCFSLSRLGCCSIVARVNSCLQLVNFWWLVGVAAACLGSQAFE